jgi:hypothetical protein
VPEVARFDWAVLATAPTHTCMLVVSESADDPLAPSIRATNELQPWVLVPDRRHISQRNLHIVDPTSPGGAPMMMEAVAIRNPTKEPGVQLLVSQADLKERVLFLLPAGVKPELREVRATQAKLTPAQVRMATAMKVDPAVAYEVIAREGALNLAIPPGQTWRIAVVARYEGPPNTSARLSLLEKQGAKILGGSTYLLRQVPKAAFVEPPKTQ